MFPECRKLLLSQVCETPLKYPVGTLRKKNFNLKPLRSDNITSSYPKEVASQFFLREMQLFPCKLFSQK